MPDGIKNPLGYGTDEPIESTGTCGGENPNVHISPDEMAHTTTNVLAICESTADLRSSTSYDRLGPTISVDMVTEKEWGATWEERCM